MQDCMNVQRIVTQVKNPQTKLYFIFYSEGQSCEYKISVHVVNKYYSYNTLYINCG